VCANARASVLGAPGYARGLKEDVAVREQELARRREDVAARATVAQRGERRGDQRGFGKAAARRGRAHGSVQCGAEAAGALHMAGKSGGGTSGSETEEEEGR
jgi:hypothetical protein